MILNFKPDRRFAQTEPLSPILRDLRVYWDFSRAQLTLPLSENLFISDLVDEMPYVLLAYGENSRFQVEFSGDAAADLLGGTPIGATTEPGGNLPTALSRCILAAAETQEPASGAMGEMQILCLPFSGEFGTVDVVLVGLVGIASAEVHTGGTVISLVR
ncbi:hypothetical protein [Nisaea nitritireducens]|uniref:hypothetical protein n=1 Tax=Nisaea nitritireducens TaxID=568392 RepID=UPI001867D18B|nr:hypothetical protein [Nisaea nitritireducens]